jgi:vacuolar protein sorting-associated protein 35
VNIKAIVIALIDRLAAYAARESENEDPEETKRQEEAAARRLAEKVKIQKARLRENGYVASPPPDPEVPENDAWGAEAAAAVSPIATSFSEKSETDIPAPIDTTEKSETSKEKVVRKFRGIPENVQLFEVFWKQVVELIKVSFGF